MAQTFREGEMLMNMGALHGTNSTKIMNKNTSSHHSENHLVKYAAWGLFTMLLLSTGLKSYSQSYFYFENKIPSPKDSSLTYYTFLTLYGDGSGRARIRYSEPVSRELRLVEINLLDSALTSGINSDLKYLVQLGEPLPIGGTNLSAFHSPKFVLKKQTDGTMVPEAIMYKSPDGSWLSSEMLVNQRKSETQLKVENVLVTGFFNQSDKFYQSLFATTSSAQVPDKRKEKLYLITVVNTLDSIIGVSTQRDLANIVSTFTLLAKDANMDIQVRKVGDNNLSKESVELALEGLHPSPIDIVVFYFSGHGFRYAKDVSPYPRMSVRLNREADLSKNNLGLEDVYKILLKKKAKVTLVLADCCNNEIDAVVPSGPTFVKTKAPNGEPVLNMTLFKKLFFPSKAASMLIASADKYQLAVGNPNLGGYFTNSFTEELRKVLYETKSNVTWLSILASTKKNASWLSLGAECGENRCVQSARFIVTPKL